jgi:hypothetical protein
VPAIAFPTKLNAPCVGRAERFIDYSLGVVRVRRWLRDPCDLHHVRTGGTWLWRSHGIASNLAVEHELERCEPRRATSPCCNPSPGGRTDERVAKVRSGVSAERLLASEIDASAFPARLATGVDPMVALRYE